MSVVSSSTKASVLRPVPAFGWGTTLQVRTSAYLQMARPRIALMTAISVGVGFTLGSKNVFDRFQFLASLVGVLLLVVTSSVWNQCLEAATDRRMSRTAQRPIAAGILSFTEASFVGFVTALLGVAVLCYWVNTTTALATLATMASYVFLYTPLKRTTSFCTTVGAIPGAMPPVLGWLAAGGSWGVEAFALFALFFTWQFPHFLAIGWLHRSDYQAAGLRMLPSFTDGGAMAGLIAFVYALVFVIVSALPSFVGLAGNFYFATALGLSCCYLMHSIVFLRRRTDQSARRLLRFSLVCLPVCLLALVVEFLWLTSV